MFLFPFLFIWFLFVLFSSVLCQLSNSFFISCFRWNHCILVFFFCFYLILSYCSLFILSPISVVTHWLLVFCIFIYSCNYILVFSSISSSLFYYFVVWCHDLLLFFLIRHYLWLIIYLFFCCYYFLYCYFMFFTFYSCFFWFCLSVCVIIFMYLLNNINIQLLLCFCLSRKYRNI